MFQRTLHRSLLIISGLILINGLLIRPDSTLASIVRWGVSELRTAVVHIIGWFTL